MANESKTAKWAEKNGLTFDDIVSKIKWLFNKNDGEEWKNSKNYKKTFTFTRKDSVVSVCISVVIVIWAFFYGMEVYNKYTEMNNNYGVLKDLSTYNLKANTSLLSSYSDWKEVKDLNTLISIYNELEDTIASDKLFEEQQKSYYEILLQNIYLPSLNVWKDPYTKNFDMTVLWQKYLENDKFQDLYLIQYRSDFVKYVWNDSDYNNIENITIWEKVDLEDSDYFYTPITISFTSPSKRSFLLLVNKLSITSNQNNIALLNEFFFYLLNAVKEKKTDDIDKLMQKYWDIFSSSSNREFSKTFTELTDEERSTYMDRVIGYDLYHWVTGDSESSLIDDEIIVKAIRDSALCNKSDTNQKCFYDFRDKYRNIPYLAYKVALEKQANRTEWLLNFLRDLPPAIAIKDFWFEKYSNSSFLNNEQEQYEWQFTFNAYGRNITVPEIEEAANTLWKLCFGEWANKVISPDTALSRVEEVIWALWWSREYLNVSTLWELQWLLNKLKEWYDKMTNYEKMIKLFEIWRMMNDANLCIQ